MGLQTSPPVGLDGLKEFMKGTTSNPTFEPGPAQPPESPVPPPPLAAPPAAANGTADPPAGGSWTFADLAKMGKQ
jgi:hypothetical protein